MQNRPKADPLSQQPACSDYEICLYAPVRPTGDINTFDKIDPGKMRKKVNASIITIGDELLIGQVIDTNSAFIAKKLNEAGISVERRIAVADKTADIINALDSEAGRVSLVITTGGLGPTSDDITKIALAKFFESKMVMNKPALTHIKELYSHVYRKKLSAINMNMAKVPENCTVMINKRGSAPCMIFEKKSTYVVSMAGVPYEMEGIMEDLIPWLKSHFQLPKIIHQTLITVGIAESDLAAMLTQFEKELPTITRLAYLPGPSGLRLRLSSTVYDKEEEREARKQFNKLKKLTKEYLENQSDVSPQIELGKMLKSRRLSLSTAESCTGGRIASMITSVSGASAYYPGSIISYSNEVKERELGVRKSTLSKYGAVSEEVVTEMIRGVIGKMKTTFGIAVSGIMGPEGGSADKPVGTVWIAVGTDKEIQTRKLHFRYDRERNITATATRALYMLKDFIEKKPVRK